MRKYKVRRRREVEFISRALEESGASLVSVPSGSEAPFEFRVATPAGEILDLVCYAFSANKYRQQGRPQDEHRFQLKYGGDFQDYHRIFIAGERSRVTLMFGVHFEAGILVAVDPAMHDPTWFSLSVEFKDRNVEETLASGWSGWERSRSDARRKIDRPLVNYQTEMLLGFAPKNFLRFVQFERIATGMDPGERLLLAERLEDLEQGRRKRHALESELGMTRAEILDMIENDSFRLKAAVRGIAAEHHLEKHLVAVEGMDEVERIDQDGRPDFRIVYRGQEPKFVECKNVLRSSSKAVRVDFQRTRASKTDPCTRFYRPQDFEILAASLHPLTERWEFRFCCTSNLPAHSQCDGRISPRVVVGGEEWVASIPELLSRRC